MDKTNCSMQNIFEWCLRNHMGISFRPMQDGYTINVLFSKHVLGKWHFWSQAVSVELIEQLTETPSFFWSNVVQEAQRRLSEKEIMKCTEFMANGDCGHAI